MLQTNTTLFNFRAYQEDCDWPVLLSNQLSVLVAMNSSTWCGEIQNAQPLFPKLLRGPAAKMLLLPWKQVFCVNFFDPLQCGAWIREGIGLGQIHLPGLQVATADTTN